MPIDLYASRLHIALPAFIVSFVLIILSTLLRLCIKIREASLQLDDCFIFLAAAGAVALFIAIFVSGISSGFGRHVYILTHTQIYHFKICYYLVTVLYTFSLGFTKLAILTFYYRIFITPLFRRIVVVIIVFVALWMAALEAVWFAECRPFMKFFRDDIPGHCFNVQVINYVISSSHLATDIAIFLLPLPIIFRLKISRQRKWALTAVFGLGLATCVISASRIQQVSIRNNVDLTWNMTSAVIFTAFEILSAILCANLPIIYPFVASKFKDLSSVPVFRSSRASCDRYGSGSGGSSGNTPKHRLWANSRSASGSGPMLVAQPSYRRFGRYRRWNRARNSTGRSGIMTTALTSNQLTCERQSDDWHRMAQGMGRPSAPAPSVCLTLPLNSSFDSELVPDPRHPLSQYRPSSEPARNVAVVKHSLDSPTDGSSTPVPLPLNGIAVKQTWRNEFAEA